MIAVIATLEATDEYAEAFAAALSEIAPICRSDAEPGCISYYPSRLPDAPNVFKVLEVYADEAAIAAHREAPHFQKLKELFGKGFAKPPVVERIPVIG